MRRRLLAETNLTSENALKLASVMKSAHNNTQDMQGKASGNQEPGPGGRGHAADEATDATADMR